MGEFPASMLSPGMIHHRLEASAARMSEGGDASLSRYFSFCAIPAAVMVLLVEREAGPTILITRRSDRLRAHPGENCCPGGRVDSGDRDDVDTALRELQEETGISRDSVEVLGRLPRYTTASGYRISPVVGYVRPPLDLHPQPDEVAEVFEVPLSLFMDPAACEIGSFGVSDYMVTFPRFDYGNNTIWGATAGILVSLRDALAAPPAPAPASPPLAAIAALVPVL